ncbi:hypothetical protein Goshw_010477 [Gossypium schwendimanii]|uniref:Uncharacterized protein n=1 Tax=Gossypium schwendimanii TaxID=34291 RepID=A0A7J9N6I4_GOSSC|nr:hypothetical protein [Gossypium schwendimanii]
MVSQEGRQSIEKHLRVIPSELEIISQVRNRDHLMKEAVVQIREVADHIQTLAVQADMLSVKYELESDRRQELALLLRKIRVLGTRAKSYL